ncbi:MAG: RsmB/NOP family class I SAM-dependent RNA methyltransferase [Alphaproteobacteria bacterium]|nr:RsmB/NOP family class I SAM-dependent RNA methyltransferase [Alphaproteobacteria bacterium]
MKLFCFYEVTIMTDLRENAFQILLNVMDEKKHSDNKLLSNDDDNAFVTMLTLTAFRKWVFIRKILKNLSSKKLSNQNIAAQCAIILGAVELLYMQTPDYAVINSYVNLIKEKTDKYVAGFVNAILRKISKQKDAFLKLDDGEFFPQDFRRMLKKSYSTKTVAKFEKISQEQPLLDITCKNHKIFDSFNAIKLPLGTVRINYKGKVTDLPDYKKGTWWIQDFSSAIAVKMLGDIKGKNVLELCAAPGGKTAQLISAGAKVTSLDVSQERLNILHDNLKRLGLSAEKVICADGLVFLDEETKKYDVVVLDAPCSATGTLRRHPEIVHLKKEKDVLRQAALQKQFLSKISNILKKGGILLYCTCSLCKEEGENQIKDFLQNNSEYKIIRLNNMVPDNLKNIITEEGFIRILPHHLITYGGVDGFFVACLQKEN